MDLAKEIILKTKFLMKEINWFNRGISYIILYCKCTATSSIKKKRIKKIIYLSPPGIEPSPVDSKSTMLPLHQ